MTNRDEKEQLSKTINTLLDSIPDAIEAVDEALIMGVVGVAQAVGQLREALDKIDNCLDQRQFSKASDLGYRDVASEFIFLQRVLGGLQDCKYDKDKLIQDIALKAKTSYEAVLPLLDQRLESAIPRDKNLPPLSKEDIQEKFEAIFKQSKASISQKK